MSKERILITVKTYPTLSRSYGETVCTAGIRVDGSWVRLYPVPFRRLDEKEQYRKFDWVECRLQQNKKDPRPESFRPLDHAELIPVGHMDTANDWWERRQLILNEARVYTRLAELISGAKDNQLSLAVFKPAKILDFVWEEEDREWDADKLRQMREMHKQMDMFEDNAWRETFQIIPKLPYIFSWEPRNSSTSWHLTHGLLSVFFPYRISFRMNCFLDVSKNREWPFFATTRARGCGNGHSGCCYFALSGIRDCGTFV